MLVAEDFLMNKVVLITGASRGLGRMLALRFATAGCRIAVNYLLNREAAMKTIREIRDKGGEALPFAADVESSKEVNSMFDTLYKEWGSIDVLINNAAIARDDILPRIKRSDWEEIITTNLTGSFNTIRGASKYMIRKKGGHIINISSWSGLKGRAGQAAYSASKAGLIGLTKSAATELGRFNIQVNAVLPGFMKTDMVQHLTESFMEAIISDNALRREQDIAEVAEFIYHLSSMKNVSGQVFNLDSRVL